MTGSATRRDLLRGLGAGTAIVGLGLSTGLASATTQTAAEEARWTFVPPARTDFETRGSTSPTVVDGTVYLGTAWYDRSAQDPTMIERGGLYAIDAETGEADWVFETDGPVLGAPQVVDGAAYFVTWVGPGEQLDQPPYFALQAVDAASGDQLWRSYGGHWAGTTETLYRTSGHGAWGVSPTVYDGRVYVSSITAPGEKTAQARQTHVGAFDAASGSLDWRQPLANRIPKHDDVTTWSVSLSNPTGLNGLVHVAEGGPNGNVLWAFDAASGERQWRYDMVSGNVDASVEIGQHTLAKGVVYVDGGAAESDEYRTGYAVDAASGEMIREIGGVPSKTHGPYNLTVSNQFAAEDPVHGYVFQDTETDKTLFASDSRRWVTVAQGLVFVTVSTLEELYVVAVDMNGEDDSSTRWSVSFGGETSAFFGAPTLANGTLYVAGHGANGTALWALPAGTSASAKDSRTLLGTLGHHDAWTGQDFEWDPALDMGDRNNLPDDYGSTATATGSTPADAGTGGSGTGGGSGTTAPSGGNASGATTAANGPGMGVVGTLASVGGASYLLSRRRDDES